MRSIYFSRLAVLWAIGVLAIPLARSAVLSQAASLEALHQRWKAGEIRNLHSVLVVQHGQTIAEWYFEGTDEIRGSPPVAVTFGPGTLHDMRSATKSVVSLLFGIALREGLIKSLDTPVLDYFPEYIDLQTLERRKIRLRDLLSMTSGLRWDEAPSYRDPRNSETAMDMAADRYRYILSRPIDSPPGTQWNYSGGDVALIAAVIARTARMPLDQYATKLFAPLNIADFTWLKDSNGIPYAASGLRLTPREMVTIGLLVLHGGRNPAGEQIVPRDWIETSSAVHANAFRSGSCAVEYGYFWWLGARCMPAWVSAIGNGGQRIYVVPSRDLVIVTTAGLYNSAEQNSVNSVLSSIEDAIR